jgi:hypothetical protein
MLRVGLQHIQVRKSKTRGQGHERRRRTEPAEVGRDVVSELFIEVFVILFTYRVQGYEQDRLTTQPAGAWYDFDRLQES